MLVLDQCEFWRAATTDKKPNVHSRQMFLTLTREVIFFSSKDYAINQLPTLLTKCCSFIFSFSSQPFQNWSGKFVTQLAVKRNSTIVHLSSRSDKNSSGLRCRNLGCIFCTENVQIYKFLTLDMQSRGDSGHQLSVH